MFRFDTCGRHVRRCRRATGQGKAAKSRGVRLAEPGPGIVQALRGRVAAQGGGHHGLDSLKSRYTGA